MKILDVPQSGSNAGTTSSRNRFGQYRRTRATPTNPRSTFQTSARSALATATGAGWSALSDATRNAWMTFANAHPVVDSLGSTVTLSGHQMYVGVAARCTAAGLNVPLIPPIDPLPAAPTMATPTVEDDDTLDVVFAPSPVPTDHVLLIWATPLRSPGRTNLGVPRLVGLVSAAGTTPASVGGVYVPRFGSLVLGSKMRIAVQLVRSDGGWSPFSSSFDAVVAAGGTGGVRPPGSVATPPYPAPPAPPGLAGGEATKRQPRKRQRHPAATFVLRSPSTSKGSA
jgi:hypothetical protein